MTTVRPIVVADADAHGVVAAASAPVSATTPVIGSVKGLDLAAPPGAIGDDVAIGCGGWCPDDAASSGADPADAGLAATDLDGLP